MEEMPLLRTREGMVSVLASYEAHRQDSLRLMGLFVPVDAATKDFEALAAAVAATRADADQSKMQVGGWVWVGEWWWGGQGG